MFKLDRERGIINLIGCVFDDDDDDDDGDGGF